jgi:hypothetical protein
VSGLHSSYILKFRHPVVLETALTDMGEVVSLGKACFAPPNAIAYADAMAGHRFAMLEMAALEEHSPACVSDLHGCRKCRCCRSIHLPA